MREEQLQEIEQIARASSDGDLKWGAETFATMDEANAKLAECLARSSSLKVHSVFREDPDMAAFAAITGNGPTSAANARFFAGARQIVLELVAAVREARGGAHWYQRMVELEQRALKAERERDAALSDLRDARWEARGNDA